MTTTEEEVIRMAREVGLTISRLGHVYFEDSEALVKQSDLVALIELVKAEENEACAKVCEDEACGGSAFNSASNYMAGRIRARRNHG